MFFPERIRSIQAGDRVLEVGPGGTPHPRADVFLERHFDAAEAAAQRGHAPPTVLNKPIVYYDGDRFPFADGEFDYVICSHVIEHVEHVDNFAVELSRVAGRGYLEYPTVYYEYLYNFHVHRNVLRRVEDVLLWLPKGSLPFAEFLPVQRFFYESLGAGFDEIVVALKATLMEGFEWQQAIKMRPARNLEELCLSPNEIQFGPNPCKAPRPSTELVADLAHRLKRRVLGA